MSIETTLIFLAFYRVISLNQRPLLHSDMQIDNGRIILSWLSLGKVIITIIITIIISSIVIIHKCNRFNESGSGVSLKDII